MGGERDEQQHERPRVGEQEDAREAVERPGVQERGEALDATGILWFVRCGASQTRVAVRKLAGERRDAAPERRGSARPMDVSLTWTQQKQAFAKRKMAGDHMTYSYNLVENNDLAHMFGLEGRHYHDRERACYGPDVRIAEPPRKDGASSADAEV